MPTLLIQHAVNIIRIVLICLISLGVGNLVLARTDLRESDSGETVLFSAAVGFAIISYGIFLLGLCQMLYSSVIYTLTAICAVLAAIGWFMGSGRRAKPPNPEASSFEDGKSKGGGAIFVNGFCGIALAISMLLGLMLILTPEIGKDALIYHIGVPKMFLEHHGIYFIPGNIFASYPFFNEMLYTWGLSLGGEVVPKEIHFAMCGFILLGMLKFQRRYVQANEFNWLPLLIFFTIPSVFQNAHVAYCDLTLAFYTFVAVYAFLNWYHTQRKIWIILCGVFSGVAMSTKYAGLYLPLSGCFGVLWGCRQKERSSREAFILLFQYLLFAFMAGAPFYLKNWIVTGNPLYPLFHQIFGGRGWSTEQAAYYDAFIKSLGMGRGLMDYLLLPWNLSFHAKMDSPVFDGLIGPLFILVLPFAVGVRRLRVEMKVALIYCLITFCFWASSAQQMRYLIPLFPFLAILAGLTLSYYRSRKFLFVLLSLFMAVGLLFNGYHIFKDFRKIRPLSVLGGHEDRNAFLTRTIPAYPMIRYVNTELPKDAYVFTIYMKHLAYLFNRPFYSDAMFESYTLEKILNSAMTPEDVHRALEKRGFTHLLFDINYVTGNAGTLTKENKKLFMAFQNKYLTLVKKDNNRYFLYRLSRDRKHTES